MKTLLNDKESYYRWRDAKLAKTDKTGSLLNNLVEITKHNKLSLVEKNQLTQQIKANNFVLFAINQTDNQAVLDINKQLGLVDYDKHLYANSQGLAYISPSQKPEQKEFIPYTNKALNWHTDGYYNPPEQRIRSFSLFCAKQADIGGENSWIDHEILYILLREKDAELAYALTNKQAMTVPAHEVDGVVRRPTSTGAVFFIDPATQQFMMRYTQRKHNITWLDIPEVQIAKEMLANLFNTPSPYHHSHKMQAGQGFICHNIPHKRSGFDASDDQRLMIRGRYFNRVK